jgi:hypothetical protein
MATQGKAAEGPANDADHEDQSIDDASLRGVDPAATLEDGHCPGAKHDAEAEGRALNSTEPQDSSVQHQRPERGPP